MYKTLLFKIFILVLTFGLYLLLEWATSEKPGICKAGCSHDCCLCKGLKLMSNLFRVKFIKTNLSLCIIIQIELRLFDNIRNCLNK